MDNLKTLNTVRWGKAKILPAWDNQFAVVAKQLTSPEAVARYKKVSEMTKGKVPWWFIAVTHHLEAGHDFRLSLAQGDPWDKISTHVPKNRGPFKSWEDAAYDALVNCPPYAARNTDWSVGGALAYLEQYNGLGYYRKHVASPYIWSGTDQYVKGKYVSDGVYNPDAVSKQLGCAGLLMKMDVFSKTSVPSVPVAHTGIWAAVGAAIYEAYSYFTNHWIAITVLAVLLGLVASSIISANQKEV